jgi:cytochrome c nitrite reductase small subunit
MKKVYGLTTSVLLIIIIAAAVVFATLSYTSSPRFCSSCHIMETRHISWKNSDHADFTNCLSCHSEPGTLGEIKAHLAGSRYLYAFVRGEVSGPILVAEVPNMNCFKCHEEERIREEPAPGEIHATYHEIHIEKDLMCVGCHGGLAHATMVPVKARSAMSLCQGCHKRERGALITCSRCHFSGPSGPAFLQTAVLKRVEE